MCSDLKVGPVEVMCTPHDIATFAKSIKNDMQPGGMLIPHGKVREEKSDNEIMTKVMASTPRNNKLLSKIQSIKNCG
jgi:hypothetical protein